MTPLAVDLATALDPVYLCQRIGLQPDDWQAQVLRISARRILLVTGRQVGKTTVAAVLAVHQAVYWPASLVLMTAPSLRQAQEVFRRSLTLYRQVGRVVPSEAENALSLTLENGSRIVSLPGDERTVRGYSAASLVLIDEAARVPDDMLDALLAMVAISGGRVVAMSTPWGKRGWFYDKAQDPRWYTVTVRSDECPRWSTEDLEDFRNSRGDLTYRQECLAEFVDASGQMFNTEDVDAAFHASQADEVLPLFGATGLSLLQRGII